VNWNRRKDVRASIVALEKSYDAIIAPEHGHKV